MQRQRPPGQKRSDTDPELGPPGSLRTPNGTQIGSPRTSSESIRTPNGASMGHGPTLQAPPQCKTMIMGMTVMAEGPAGAGSVAQAADKSGSRVGESEGGYYKREKKLGEGGMGAVYKALMIRTAKDGTVVMERPVAIKVVKFDEALEGLEGEARENLRETLYSRFINEVQVIAKLKHPNIIDIVDFGEDFGEGPFYVMEFLEGTDLSEIINEGGPLPWGRARALIAQTCKGLDAAHNHKEMVDDPETGEKKDVPHPIVHRDIKPENIFVITDSDGEQTAKVLDFGIAKIVPPSIKDPTHGGEMVLGTPYYMAPEQARGMTIDKRTDVYGMGATMYHVLTGCTVFHGDTVAELLGKLTQEAPIPLRERRPDLDIPEEAERIVMKCLEKDPAKRYQSMAELRDDIVRSAGMGTMDIARLRSGEGWNANSAPFPRQETPGNDDGANRTASEGEVATASVQKKRRRRLFGGIAAGIGALAAAGTMTALLMTRQPDSEHTGRPAPAAARIERDARPVSEPIQKDVKAPQVTSLPMAEKERVITLRTEVEGVRISVGEMLLCTTKEDGSCSIKLQKGEALSLKLEKTGYKEGKAEIYKDTSGSVAVAMELRPKAVVRKKPRKPPMRVKPVW